MYYIELVNTKCLVIALHMTVEHKWSTYYIVLFECLRSIINFAHAQRCHTALEVTSKPTTGIYNIQNRQLPNVRIFSPSAPFLVLDSNYKYFLRSPTIRIRSIII